MNVEETARQIARISPAAGREADKLVAEINRLNDENRSRSTTQENTKRRMAEYLWGLFESDVPEDMTASALWVEATERVRELLPENRRRFKQEMQDREEQYQKAMEANYEVHAYDLHAALGRLTNAKAHEGFPNWRAWWDNLLRDVKELHALNLARVDRREMQQIILELLWNFEGSGIDLPRPATDQEFWDAYRSAVDRLHKRIEERTQAIAEELSAALGGGRVRPDGYPTDLEWLSALIQAAKEIREAQQTEPLDIASLQAQLDRHSSALAVTHSAFLEMQTEYQKERSAKVKACRDLQVALADVGFYKVSASDADMRLQLVDMALRGQMPSVAASAPYRTDTSARADRMFHDLKDAVETAERELNWRKQMTVQRDESDRELARLKESGARGSQEFYQARFDEIFPKGFSAESAALDPQYADQPMKNAAVRFAECGQPYPCEHAPDGGNHPVKP